MSCSRKLKTKDLMKEYEQILSACFLDGTFTCTIESDLNDTRPNYHLILSITKCKKLRSFEDLIKELNCFFNGRFVTCTDQGEYV